MIPRDEKRERLILALTLIGTRCDNLTTGRCSAEPGRTANAEYTAEKWCDQCIAAWGLGVD